MSKEKIFGIDRVLARVTADSPLWPRGASYQTCKKWRREDPCRALSRLVKKAGSQAKLAAMLGVSQKTISSWLLADLPLSSRALPEPRNDVERTVRSAGGQPKVAADLGVTQQCIGNWCKKGYVPVARAQEFEMLYGVPRTSIINPKLRNALGAGGEL